MARALRAGDTREFRFSVHLDATFEVQSRTKSGPLSEDRADADSTAVRLILAQALRSRVLNATDDDLAYDISDVQEVGRS